MCPGGGWLHASRRPAVGHVSEEAYIVGIAAEAAGPTPPVQWLRALGSPRTPAQNRRQAQAPDPLLVLGTVHGDWVIGHISTDVTDLLGYQPDALLGRSALELVHPSDVAKLREHAGLSRQLPGGTYGQVRFAAASGGWVPCRILLQPLAGQDDDGWAFAVSPVAGDRVSDKARVRELEDRLRRVAREVSASGVVSLVTTVPTSLELPELHELTPREYEIVVRLASGERVSTIARGLFLSESTVRNHLTAVYRKFGLRSQGELLMRLRSPDAATPEA
jgi:PAS domain S-box-containing protein